MPDPTKREDPYPQDTGEYFSSSYSLGNRSALIENAGGGALRIEIQNDEGLYILTGSVPISKNNYKEYQNKLNQYVQTGNLPQEFNGFYRKDIEPLNSQDPGSVGKLNFEGSKSDSYGFHVREIDNNLSISLEDPTGDFTKLKNVPATQENFEKLKKAGETLIQKGFAEFLNEMDRLFPEQNQPRASKTNLRFSYNAIQEQFNNAASGIQPPELKSDIALASSPQYGQGAPTLS